MSYVIARAHIRDLPRVKPFWKAMLQSYVRLASADFPVRDPNEAWARRHDEYHMWLNEGAGMLFLATDPEQDDKIVGYAAVKFTASGSAFDMGERFGELESLAVSEEARGEGLGTQLIEACRKELEKREISYWSLDVLAVNDDAQRLYERSGFHPFMLRMIRRTDALSTGMPVDPLTAPLMVSTGEAAAQAQPAEPDVPPARAGLTATLAPGVRHAGEAARVAARRLAVATTGEKDRALHAMADALQAHMGEILEANARDVERARAAGTSESTVDRLSLTEDRVWAIAEAVREVAALPDPVGEVVRGSTMANGLQIRQVRVPMGVVGMIYEARPNVTVDAAALGLKSGNAVILRGGSAAAASNRALVAVIRAALAERGLPEDAVTLLDEGGHDAARALMTARGLVDLVIPRGGAELIRTVVMESTVPVIETGIGVNHVYVDAAADLDKALALVMNSKTHRPSVCNAAESLVVHESVADEFLPKALTALAGAGVVLHVAPDVTRRMRRRRARHTNWRPKRTTRPSGTGWR
jgi:gamma-glutamyl phosphate reductase